MNGEQRHDAAKDTQTESNINETTNNDYTYNIQFKELTYEKLVEQKAKIAQLNKALKRKKKDKEVNADENIINGDIINENVEEAHSNNKEDPSLEDGMPLPKWLGKVPKHLVNKNLEELDSYLSSRYEV